MVYWCFIDVFFYIDVLIGLVWSRSTYFLPPDTTHGAVFLKILLLYKMDHPLSFMLPLDKTSWDVNFIT